MMTAEERVKAAAVLGCLVGAASGIKGRVRLQKSLYLLQRKGLPELRPFTFSYHDYGPYSAALAGLLEESVRAGLIEEVSERFDDEWQRFEYRPGSRLEEYVPLLPQESQQAVRELVAMTKSVHWRALELIATVDFLQRQKGGSRDAAMRKALTLKPACEPFKDDAAQVLDHLGLN